MWWRHRRWPHGTDVPARSSAQPGVRHRSKINGIGPAEVAAAAVIVADGQTASDPVATQTGNGAVEGITYSRRVTVHRREDAPSLKRSQQARRDAVRVGVGVQVAAVLHSPHPVGEFCSHL